MLSSTFDKTEEELQCQRKIYYATRLLCFPIYGTPNDTDAVHIMIMHDTANVCLLEKPNAMGKLPSFCQPAANVRSIITLPSRLWNSVFKFFTHSFAADVVSLSRCWQEVLNELQCRLFSIHPLPRCHSGVLCAKTAREHLPVAADILGDKDQGISGPSSKRQSTLWAEVQG